MDFENAAKKYIKSEKALENFKKEIEKIDRRLLEICADTVRKKQFEKFSPDEVENPPYFLYDEKYSVLGRENFHLFAFATLAGGSATRFFSKMEENPPVKSKALFPFTENHNFIELFGGEILASSVETGYISPWIIMVSDNNAEEICDYFEEPLFGFPREFVFIIKQDSLPRFDDEGFPIVSKDGFLSWTGNGHGGLFFALRKDISETLLNQRSKTAKNMKELLYEIGVRHVLLHNVDNIFSHPTDLVRLGFHINQKALFTISAVERKDTEEKIGVIVFLPRKSRFYVIEYSFADPSIFRREKNGRPYYNIGHINTNIFSLEIIDDFYLYKLKPVLYTGKVIKVDGKNVKANSVEFLNQAIVSEIAPERVGILLLPREKFFSPTKTLYGEDSLETSQKKYFSYIREKIGVDVPHEAYFELAPFLSFGKTDVFDTSGWEIHKDSYFYFGAFFSTDGKCISSGFKLMEGAKFSIKARNPFGKIILQGRKIKGFSNPPKVKVGKNVVIRGKVEVLLEDGSEFVIKDGCVIQKDIRVKLKSGERFVIGDLNSGRF